MSDSPESLTREEIYERVWAKPIRDVARDLGMSAVGLAKICVRLNIPRPSREYWANQAIGKAVERPPLPAAQPGDGLEWVWYGREPRRVPFPIPQAPDGSEAKAPEQHLPTLHPILVDVGPHFAKTHISRCGYLRPTKRRLVDIFVSQAMLARALDVANSIFLDLERCGHRVMIAKDPELWPISLDQREKPSDKPSYELDSWTPSSPTVVYIGTVAFALTLYELSEAVEMRLVGNEYVRVGHEPPRKPRSRVYYSDLTTTKDVPSGRLCLRAASPYKDVSWQREWRERAACDPPLLASDISSVLEHETPKIVALIRKRDRLAEEQRKRDEEFRRKWRLEEDKKKRAAAVQESINEILELAEAWSGRVRTEAFFADAEQCAESFADEERAKVVARISRARALLNPKNPLERLMSWKAPEERLPPELRDGIPLPIDFLEASTSAPQPQLTPAPISSDRPKSYWETRRWWQRH